MIEGGELLRVISYVIKAVLFIIKTLFKVCKVTGGWLFIPLTMLLTTFFTDWRLWQYSMLHPSSGITFYLLWIGLIIMLYFSTQNFMRYVKKDANFKLLSLFKKDSINNILKGNPTALKTKNDDVRGVFFGKVEDDYITKKETEDGHILVIGGAGSGKSSCIAIPSLITWQDRIFAIDIKGELAEKSGRNAAIFNPADDNSEFGYDPYYLLNESENAVQDAREIALCLIPLPAESKDNYWIEAAQNILTGCILYYSGKGMGFVQTLETILITPIRQILEEICQGDNFESKIFTNKYVMLEDKVLADVTSQLSNGLMTFATDPQLKRALNKSKSIDPTFLERGEDVFIQIPEHKLEQWKGLLSLIVQQFLKHFERRPEGNSTPVLFLLDEFARLGKIEVIANGLATLRSKKIHICILTQSLAQIDVLYGKTQRQVIADNCSYKAVLSATDTETQDYFSRLVGTYDKVKITQSANYEEYTKMGKGTGQSKTTEEKRIIKPEEFAYLKDIVLLTPFGYARVDKAPYYTDKLFLNK